MWLPRPLPLRRVLQSFSAHPGPGAVEFQQTDVPLEVVSRRWFLNFATNHLPFLFCFHGYQIAPGPLTFLPAVPPRQSGAVKRVPGAALRSSSCSRDKWVTKWKSRTIEFLVTTERTRFDHNGTTLS